MSDADIRRRVMHELTWNTDSSTASVEVEVTSGIVTLTGTVDSWAGFRTMARAAHRVTGVLDVANDLVVMLPGVGDNTDSNIAQAVRRTLQSDGPVPDELIRSTVSQGTVTLEGTVSLQSHRADVEESIGGLAGVTRVINQIEVKATEGVNLTDARAAVEKALETNAALEAHRIGLTAVDGVITVSGIVHSWQEKDAVLRAVRETRGATEIVDHISIR